MSRNARADESTSPGEPSSLDCPEDSIPTRPGYMTVGSGSTPEAAARLVSMLEHDSGYEGSFADEDTASRHRQSAINGDGPVIPSSSLFHGAGLGEQDRRYAQITQMRYSQNKNALARSIQSTVETLKSFQTYNLKWPAHYPSMLAEPRNSLTDSRPGLQHTQSDFESVPRSPDRPQPPRRADTSIGTSLEEGESSASSTSAQKRGPRLVTPQLAHKFSVLKLELRMGGRTQADLVHSLEKGSVASLLDGQIQQSIRHLHSLQERIEDTSSKVLVTGDLNAGKSTFCNALLRQKILPEDQQPCTNIFCEVLDYRKNNSVEEVHAVLIGSIYNSHDESTYRVFQMHDLDKLVINNEHYEQCKIYIRDIRSAHESLLNNGVVDISLIDAPGLNSDSLKTTAVFARQEEIDVVVFVVSAANHFTESAKNFIFSAAQEKAYFFMVVNGFDTIRDQQRCKETVLRQVYSLSPTTFKESSELVHFVSSNAIPIESPDGDDGGDDDDSSNKGKGKEIEKVRDFDNLEASLRRFALEKRARSKLAPAKTYLLNVLGDICNLSAVNANVAESEVERIRREMDALEPEFEETRKVKTEAGDLVGQIIEVTTADVYQYTLNALKTSVSQAGGQQPEIPYPGLFSAFQYADDILNSMLSQVTETVRTCEQHARSHTVQSYNGIKNLGILHLGNDLHADIMFRPDRMFRKSAHVLARQIEINIDLWDFFDLTSLWERQEKVAGTGLAVTAVSVVSSRLMGGAGWLDGTIGAMKIMGSGHLKRLIIPSLIASIAIGVSYILASIPQSLPHRLKAKLSTQLAAIDYTHSNALRISSEVRRALKGPANDVNVGLQRNLERLQAKKEETSRTKAEASEAKKYFSNLYRQSNGLKQVVQRIDLEAAPPATVSVLH